MKHIFTLIALSLSFTLSAQIRADQLPQIDSLDSDDPLLTIRGGSFMAFPISTLSDFLESAQLDTALLSNDTLFIITATPDTFTVDLAGLTPDSTLFVTLSRIADSTAAIRADIPANVSELTNDSGYLTSESDAVALAALADSTAAIRGDFPSADGVVTGGSVSGSTLSLTRSEGLSDVDIDVSSISGGGQIDTNFLRTTLPKSGNNTRGYYALPLDFSFDTISNYANTLLDIQYNYDAGGDTITMPEGVTLRGDGGVISNAVVVLDGTDLIGDREVFGSNVTLQGTVRRKEVNLKHIGYNPDSLEVLFSRALAVLPAGGHIIVPADDYLLNGPIHVTTSNTHIVFEEGNTVGVNDTGNWPNLLIDTTKATMPLIKTSIQFDSVQDCSLRGLNLDSQGMLHDGAVSPQEGQSGVHVRKGLRVTISDCSIVNVFPSFFGETFGGFGEQRYTGILVTQSRDCTVSGNYVYRCKYDGIGIRMQNYDILVENNIIGYCAEGIQASHRYATVLPREDNLRTKITGNRIFEIQSVGIVFHAQSTIVQENVMTQFIPKDGAIHGIRAIEADGSIIIDNVILGNDDHGVEQGTYLSTDSIASLGIVGIGFSGGVIVRGNRVEEVDIGIQEASTSFNSRFFDNELLRVNHGYNSLLPGWKARRAIWARNRIVAYRTGLEINDRGTVIRDNNISEADGWGGTSIGLNLDPDDSGDADLIVSGTMPTGFSTIYKVGGNRTQIEPDNKDYGTGDRTYQAGTITVNTGETQVWVTRNMAFLPQGGDCQCTQMTGDPVLFRFTSSGTFERLYLTLGSAATETLTFSYTCFNRSGQD